MWNWFKRWFDLSTEHPVFGSIYTGVTGRSGKWPKVRADWLGVHPYCEACGAITNLNVHHIEPFYQNPEMELDPSNLITLCETPSRNCHFNIGHGGNWKMWNCDVRTDVKYMYDMYQRIRKTRK